MRFTHQQVQSQLALTLKYMKLVHTIVIHHTIMEMHGCVGTIVAHGQLIIPILIQHAKKHGAIMTHIVGGNW